MSLRFENKALKHEVNDKQALTNLPAKTALRLDVITGVTAAAVVLPKAMAYRTVAILPVAVGLYTVYPDVRVRNPRVVALDMSRVTDIEYSALQVLMDGEKRATENGSVVWLAGLNPEVSKVVHLAGLAERMGRERLLPDARTVIKRYQVQFAADPRT